MTQTVKCSINNVVLIIKFTELEFRKCFSMINVPSKLHSALLCDHAGGLDWIVQCLTSPPTQCR